MYAPSHLVKKPAYLFQIAASNERHVIFRTYTRAKTLSWKALFGRGNEGDSYGENQLFESLIIDLKFAGAKRVKTREGIEIHYLRHSDFSCLIKIPFADNRRFLS